MSGLSRVPGILQPPPQRWREASSYAAAVTAAAGGEPVLLEGVGVLQRDVRAEGSPLVPVEYLDWELVTSLHAETIDLDALPSGWTKTEAASGAVSLDSEEVRHLTDSAGGTSEATLTYAAAWSRDLAVITDLYCPQIGPTATSSGNLGRALTVQQLGVASDQARGWTPRSEVTDTPYLIRPDTGARLGDALAAQDLTSAPDSPYLLLLPAEATDHAVYQRPIDGVMLPAYNAANLFNNDPLSADSLSVRANNEGGTGAVVELRWSVLAIYERPA